MHLAIGLWFRCGLNRINLISDAVVKGQMENLDWTFFRGVIFFFFGGGVYYFS